MKRIFTVALLCIPAAFGLRKWLGKFDKKRKQHMAVLFNRLVLQHKLVIEHSEIVSGSLIALDRKNKKLLAIEQTKSSGQQHCIPLTNVSTALVVRETGEAGSIQKIFLELKQKGTGKIIRLCFFDAANNCTEELLRLTRSALIWKSRVNLYKHTGFVPTGQAYVL